jgi:hypothetical protein
MGGFRRGSAGASGAIAFDRITAAGVRLIGGVGQFDLDLGGSVSTTVVRPLTIGLTEFNLRGGQSRMPPDSNENKMPLRATMTV